VFVDATEAAPDLVGIAEAVTDDVVPFDQRGCLSPRVVFALGEATRTRILAEALSEALARAALRIPIGRLDSEELRGRVRYRDTLLATGTLLPSGDGFVGLDLDGRAVVVPPAGRNVHVMRCAGPEHVTGALGSAVTSIAVAGGPALVERVSSFFPHARVTEPGRMQTPPFDGPVDRRPA
jgi:hypothetical protein